MASTVNTQITDSIADTSTEILGNAPAIAVGNFYQATSQALANAAHNATLAQQQANMLSTAVTSQGIALIYSIKF